MLDQQGLEDFLGDEFAYLSVTESGSNAQGAAGAAAAQQQAQISANPDFQALFQHNGLFGTSTAGAGATAPPGFPVTALMFSPDPPQLQTNTTSTPNGSLSDDESFDTNDASAQHNAGASWDSNSCADCPICMEQFCDSVLELGKGDDSGIKNELTSLRRRTAPAAFGNLASMPSLPHQTQRPLPGFQHCQPRMTKGMTNRKIKHRELEVVRRRKMNAKFDELRDLVGPCPKKDKGTVLETAVNRLSLLKLEEMKILAQLDPRLFWKQLAIEMDCNVSCGIAVINAQSQFVNANTYFWQKLLRFNSKEELGRTSLLQVTAPGWLILLTECLRQCVLTRQSLCLRLEVTSGLLSTNVPVQNVFCECIVSPAPPSQLEGNSFLASDHLLVILSPVGYFQVS